LLDCARPYRKLTDLKVVFGVFIVSFQVVSLFWRLIHIYCLLLINVIFDLILVF